jgi:hypothetical protein
MNDAFLWLGKIILVLFCVWYVMGGPARLEQEITQIKNESTKKVQVKNSASVYRPTTQYQTIIVR